MDISFTRSASRADKTLVIRNDGVTLTVPVFGPLDPIPHDLAHYVVERELELREGFWGTVAAGGIFEGMRVVSGRQRPHALERSKGLMKAHHRGILFSEVVVEAVLRAVKGEPPSAGPLAIDYPGLPMRTTADRLSLIARLRPPMEEMCARWQTIPAGGALRVIWRDVPIHRGADNSLPIGRHRYRANIRPLARR